MSKNITNTFKVKLNRDIALTWMSYSYAKDSLQSFYKRKVQVTGGHVYYGCFPINIEPLDENSTESTVTISYDGLETIPEIIHVKEIF